MNTTEKIALGTAVLIWIGIAIGLIFSLANYNLINDFVVHIKVLYFIGFVSFTLIGIVYLKLFIY